MLLRRFVTHSLKSKVHCSGVIFFHTRSISHVDSVLSLPLIQVKKPLTEEEKKAKAELAALQVHNVTMKIAEF
jgi:hypothetical protein